MSIGRSFVGAALAGWCVTSLACGAGRTGEALRPTETRADEALGKGTASKACPATPSETLVVDLSSSERSDLELAMKDGVAVVKYDCRSLKILKDCKAPGHYSFAGVSRKEDVVQLTSSDEISANLPVEGVKLAAEVKRGSSIDVALVMIGKRRTLRLDATRGELEGQCEGATHVVRGAFVGAFAMASGTVGKVRAAADLFGAGAGAGSASEKKVGHSDGDLEACRKATTDAPAPPDQCQSAMRLELIPVGAERKNEADIKAFIDADRSGTAATCAPGLSFVAGKCTAEKQEEPSGAARMSSAPSIPKTSAQLCDDGDAFACDHAGREQKSLPLLQRGCALGASSACVGAGFFLAGQGKVAEAERALDRVCAAADVVSSMACVAWGTARITGKLDGKPIAKDATKAAHVYGQACAGGAALGCHAAGQLALVGNGVAKDPAAARASFERGCNAKVKGWDACLALGRAYEEGVGGPKEPQKALAAYELTCVYGACVRAGRLYESGAIGGKPDLVKALAAYDRECPKESEACVAKGALLEKQDKAAALAFYQSQCASPAYPTWACGALPRVGGKAPAGAKPQPPTKYTPNCPTPFAHSCTP